MAPWFNSYDEGWLRLRDLRIRASEHRLGNSHHTPAFVKGRPQSMTLARSCLEVFHRPQGDPNIIPVVGMTTENENLMSFCRMEQCSLDAL